MTADARLEAVLGALWPSSGDPSLRDVLPYDLPTLREGRARLHRYVSAAPRSLQGTIDPAAIIRGDVVHMAPGSVIEAGAVVHESCRLVLGPGSVVRAGGVLRDDVVIGADCLVGAHCEVARSVLLGPGAALGHSIVFLDSIAGARSLLSAFIGTANTHLTAGREISVRTSAGRLATGRTHLGALIGEGARIGPGATISPGTIVTAGVHVPPGAALLGVVDDSRAQALRREYLRRTHPL